MTGASGHPVVSPIIEPMALLFGVSINIVWPALAHSLGHLH